MQMNPERPQRKFLKTIYEIQKSFGSHFGNISRNFSFGIKPTESQKLKLETWFTQVNDTKKELYLEIYNDFKQKPFAYLGTTFDYGTFFKGNTTFNRLKKNRHLIKSEPVLEGFKMEISGSIRSYITNHRRIFDENISELERVKSKIKDNHEKLTSIAIVAEDELKEFIANVEAKTYDDILATSQSLEDYESLLFSFNEAISEYNYETNQINTARKLRLSMLDKLSRLPVFPGVTEKKAYELEDILSKLKAVSRKPIESTAIILFLQKAIKRLERKREGKKKRFEDRLTAYLYRKCGKKFENNKNIIHDFTQSIGRQILKLEAHMKQKLYDGASRNKYFELIAFRARLAQPEIMAEINTVLSQVKSYFLQGKTQREIITIPGFSWNKSIRGKPLKLTALGFIGKQLYICIASSSRAFSLNNDGSSRLKFVKTTGGQKKKNSVPKTIEYVKGEFHEEIDDDLPLFLPLHFGKSYARRYLFNKQWGLFSKNPQIFLNNARIKREKVNPGDPWKYYLDVSMSGEKVYGYTDFAHDILTKSEYVIGIDRGEVIPIAFTVLRLRDKKVIEKGFLARAYIEKLKTYDSLIRAYQSKGRLIPKYLKSKIGRLQKTLLETATSEILFLVSKYKAVVVLENLNDQFSGSEKSLIPKKTYKKIEKLLTDSLQLAGLLRVDTTGHYWGALKSVFPAATSQTCLQCETVWNKKFKDEIISYSKSENYKNINFARKVLRFDTKEICLNEKYIVFNKEKKHNEVRKLENLQKLVGGKDEMELLRHLKIVISPRISQDTFICGLCRFQENADIVGSANIAKRGANLIQKSLAK